MSNRNLTEREKIEKAHQMMKDIRKAFNLPDYSKMTEGDRTLDYITRIKKLFESSEKTKKAISNIPDPDEIPIVTWAQKKKEAAEMLYKEGHIANYVRNRIIKEIDEQEN